MKDERKISRKALQQTASLLTATLESTADGLLVIDISGKITIYNNKFLSMWHIPESLAAKREDTILLENVLSQLKEPDVFIEKVKQLYAQLEADSFDFLEFKDGRVFERFSQPQRLGNEIVGRVWSFRDVTARKRTEEALLSSEEEARRLAKENVVIAEIGRIISSTLNIEEVYERFAEKVREIIPFDRITVNAINRKDNIRIVRYVNGERFSDDRIGQALSLAGTRTEHVARTKSSLLINSKNEADIRKRFPGALSHRSWSHSTLMVPLISKDEVIGVLDFQAEKIDAYSEHDLHLAERMGSQIASAIANAELFLERRQVEENLRNSEKAARRLAKENDLVAEIGRIISSTLNIEEVYERFAEKVREIIPFDIITINIVNTGDNTRTVRYTSGMRITNRKIGDVIPLGGSMTERIVRTRSSLLMNAKNNEELSRQFPSIVHTITANIQSMMGIPLVSQDEIIGTLLLRSLQPDAYTEKDLLLAERMGSHIAGAVANAQLFLERVQAEEALKESEAKYHDLYENAPDMYYSVDSETGIINECNETFVRMTGYAREEIIGRPIFELYHSDCREEVKEAFHRFRKTGESHNRERRIKCKDGRIMDVSLNISARRDSEGKIVYSRSIWHDITERKEHEKMIRALSITDQLTGLYNRRGFTTLAEQQLRVAERTGNGLVLLFADVDDLKQINDTFGHKSGDEALVEAANVLKEVFRKMDIIARMGGDEFAVLAPETSIEYSDMVKNRLQDQLNICNSCAGREYNLSLSIGVVYHDPSIPRSLDELINRADSLMYEQKRCKKPFGSQEGSDTE